MKYKKETLIKIKESFIERSKLIHNNKYDYSNVDYKTSKIKVTIICPDHGEFEQQPNCHVRGIGCKKCCDKNQTKTLVSFIDEANVIHNNKYSYSTVVYLGSFIKVIIRCPDHGEFEQTPNSHLKGNGCQKCNTENRRLSLDKFLKKCQEIHNNLYEYDLTSYTHRSGKIKYKCKIHGWIEQDAASHISGCKCPKCYGQYKTTTELIVELRIVHGQKYDYSLTNYINSKTKIKIICPDHGEFEQTPNGHLQGQGCPRCVVSKKETLWLDSMQIPLNFRNQQIKINNKKFKPDAIDKENKIIYEFNGDFWHGNPNRFNPNDINKRTKTTFLELHNNTLLKEKIYKDAGYTVISIWESDWDLTQKVIINQTPT